MDPLNDEIEVSEEPQVLDQEEANYPPLDTSQTQPDDEELNPALVNAVVWQESRGNPRAVGPETRYGRAYGLMQLLPATAQEAARRLGRDPSEIDLLDAETNKALGSEELRSLRDKYQGDERLALAAYNHGQGNVGKLQAKYGDSYEDIEPHLPEETRKYVPSVLKKKAELEGTSPQNEQSQVAALNHIPTDKVSSDVKGFATVLESLIQNPEFDSLPFSEKVSSIADIYHSKKWAPDTYLVLKQVISNYWDSADPTERPDFREFINPPPRLESGQDPKKVLTRWKEEELSRLYKEGMNPAFFGNALDEYMESAADNETQAYASRNRSFLRTAGTSVFNYGREAVKGLSGIFTDTAAGAARLSGAYEAANTIQALPEELGKPTRDYLYETDADGYLKLGEDGNPIPRWQTGAARTAGAVAGFIAGGAQLKALGYAQSTISGLLFAGNALPIANENFKETYEQTGDAKKAYLSSMFALPAAAVGALGEVTTIAKWANPVIGKLSDFNKAKYLANVMARNAGVNVLAGAGMSTISQAGVSLETGRPISGGAVLESGLVQGLVAGGIAGYQARNVRPAPEPAANTEAPTATTEAGTEPSQLLLPAPPVRVQQSLPPGESRVALPGTPSRKELSGTPMGPEDLGPIIAFEPTSQEAQNKVADKLEAFQRSSAAELHLTAEQAKNIPPELFSVFEVTPLADEGGAVLVKKETYTPKDAESIDELTGLIEKLSLNLKEAPSPSNTWSLVEERQALKKQLFEQSKGVNRATVEAARQRQEYQKAYDTAKTSYESQKDPVLRRVAKLELEEAQNALVEFDAANEGVYEAAHKIGELEDQIFAVNEKLKEVQTPTYVNDLKAKERNLQALLDKRNTLLNEARLKADSEAQAQREAALEARKAAFEQSGIEASPTTDFSKGVLVDGHTLLPINDKWYVVDPHGELKGNGHHFFYDAVESIHFAPGERSRQFILKDVPDRTALRPEDLRAFEERKAQEAAKAEEVAQTEAKAAKNREAAKAEAIKYREKLHAEEDAKAKKAALKAGTLRGKGRAVGKKGRRAVSIPEVTALNVSGEEAGTVGSEAGKAEESLQRKVRPTSIGAKSRRLLSRVQPGKVLSSDYTKPVVFAEDSTKVIHPQEFVKRAQSLADKLAKGTKIFQGGKTRKDSLGFLNYVKNFVQIGRFNDVNTLMHELTHVIDKAVIGKWDARGMADYSGLPLDVREAAKDQAITFYPTADTFPEHKQIQEGLATFFQHYATGQPVRPELLSWFNTTFAKDFPEIHAELQSLKDLAHEYYNQTPEAYQQSTVVRTPGALKRTAAAVKSYVTNKKFVDRWIDRAAIFKDIDKATGNVGRLRDVWSVTRGRARGLADSFFDNGIMRANGNREYVATPIKSILSDLKAQGKLKTFETYLDARSDLADLNNGLEIASNAEDIRKTIASIEQREPTVIQAAQAYYDAINTLQKMVGESSKGGAAYISALREKNLEATGTTHGYYLPKQREGFSSVNSRAKRSGSSRAKVDPLNNIRNAFQAMTETAMEYRMKEALIDVVDGPNMSYLGQYMREVTGMERRGLEKKYESEVSNAIGKEATARDKVLYSFIAENIPTGKESRTFTLMDGNKLRFFEVDPRLPAAFSDELPDFVKSGFFRYMYRPGAQLLRPFATTFRAAFQAKNLIRDNLAAWRYLQSEDFAGGFKDLVNIFRMSANQTINAALNKNLAKWAEEAGLHYSSRLGAVQDARLEIQRKVGSTLLDFGDATFNTVENLLSAGETGTRLAAMKLTADKMGIKDFNAPLTPVQELELLLAFKRATTEFPVQGSAARVVNLGTNFFTARINELTRLPNDFRRNPGKTATVALGMLTAGVYHALAHADREWYQEMTPEAKMNAIWSTVNVGGVERPVLMPLDSLSALFWGLGQAIGNKMTETPDLPLEYTDLARAYFAQNVSPVNSVFDLGGPWVKELIQQEANKDFYFNKAIVPPSLQYQDPRIQYNEFTSELAKNVGSLINVSPIRIDHLIRATVPAVSDWLRVADRNLGLKTEKEVQSSNFLLDAFSRAGSASSIMDRSQKLFMDKLFEARENKSAETPEEALVRKKLEKINRNVSDLNTVIYGVDDQELKDKLRQEKRSQLKQGILIAQGATAPVKPTGVHVEAKVLRKKQTEASGEALKKKKASIESGALQGDTSASEE